jgi:hypothetical protein
MVAWMCFAIETRQNVVFEVPGWITAGKLAALTVIDVLGY